MIEKEEQFEIADAIVTAFFETKGIQDTHPQILMLAAYKIFTTCIDNFITIPQAQKHILETIKALVRRAREWEEMLSRPS